jgi:hypothetical protein
MNGHDGRAVRAVRRPINPDDDAVQVQAGFAHESCLQEYDGEKCAHA